MGISEEITRLANSHDHDPDDLATRALVQGMLFGSLVKQDLLQIDDIYQPRDADGDYLHHFVITTRSGKRIKVQVEVD